MTGLICFLLFTQNYSTEPTGQHVNNLTFSYLISIRRNSSNMKPKIIYYAIVSLLITTKELIFDNDCNIIS
jgi:hypothetical protein